jgi:uncharacterized protein YndB with AHSA1/START domain
MNKRNELPVSAERELLITRLLKAPRALVFKAWTQAEHMARWMRPHGFTVRHHTLDVRPGGVHRACLLAPDGTEHWVRGVYQEIIEPERLVFTHAWEDESGKPRHETLVTITFAEQEGQTLMTFRQTGFESEASRDGHRGGWIQTFERLDTYLAEGAQ